MCYNKNVIQDIIQGNHKVYNPNFTENTDENFIGNLNPIRYRGYYYDVESGMYYLQTRYYDPSIGQFISPDSPKYLDLETITGLNLYAYCNYNPVMYTDPYGTTKWWEWIIAGLTVTALLVGSIALTVASDGAASPTIAFALEFGASILIGGTISAASSLATQVQNESLDWGDFGIDIGVGFLTGAISFGLGQIFNVAGQVAGKYFGEMVIGGLRVSNVFSSSLLMSIGSWLFEAGGGILTGMYLDKKIGLLLNRHSSLTERFKSNMDSTWFSTLVDILGLIW